MAGSRSLETLTAGEFRSIRGSRLRIGNGSPGNSPVSFEVEVAEVTEYAGTTPGAFRSPFSVVFHGPPGPVLPQGIYRFEHERLGVMDLFIVPVGPDTGAGPGQAPAAMRYEAVFG